MESLDIDLRPQTTSRLNEMLEKFRITAAKRQAEFYRITQGRSPIVSKESVAEEAHRLLSEWQERHLKRVSDMGNSEKQLHADSNGSSGGAAKEVFECPRCFKVFHSSRRYTKHVSGHFAGNGSSYNAVMMASTGSGRGLERSSRMLSESEREDLRYFLNDAYQ